MTSTSNIFDLPGPLLTKPEHGKEPSLREILFLYYCELGEFSVNRANQMCDEYIEKWLSEHGEARHRSPVTGASNDD